jgi:hypothetical protein
MDSGRLHKIVSALTIKGEEACSLREAPKVEGGRLSLSLSMSIVASPDIHLSLKVALSMASRHPEGNLSELCYGGSKA